MNIYVVQKGDNIDKIASEYHVKTDQLIYTNQLVYPYALAIGQALLIPEEIETKNISILTGGYAYPFISPWVLDQTLPYIADLYVFSYGFDTEGNLIPPQLDDEWMIREAKKKGKHAILTLTPFGRDGLFNNHLISSVVNDQEAEQNLISQLEDVVERKGYHGIDVDFEYILADDRDSFTLFVANLTDQLNEYGIRVSVALAPKTSADQPGLLYEGKDYHALGEAANQVLLMTYERGYTYSEPMAVAPINKVRQVVDYAITEIPATKIVMGIPNYGYDWPLPYRKGVTKAQTIGNVEAVRIAIENDAEIKYDETAQSPYFKYYKDGVQHEVWFEDVRSIQQKLNLVSEYSLKGVGYWQIMQLFRANWVLLEDQFRIE